jgi:hypothetical protein
MVLGGPPRRQLEPVAAGLTVGLNAVILAVTGGQPRVLTVSRAGHTLAPAGAALGGGVGEEALPFGPLDAHGDPTLELGLRAWVSQQTGLELGYVEQLYTFADRHRDPEEQRGGPRVVSVAYLALVREGRLAGSGAARWRNAYDFLPWEDSRAGRPAAIDEQLAPALHAWISQAGDRGVRARRAERAEIAFGLRGVAWDPERVLERYELLYEAGLVDEAERVRRPHTGATTSRPAFGEAMALDHRRIAATALGRLRGKLRYRPVVFELLASRFTLFQLQNVVEALAGTRLHKQNFRRLVETGGLVEGTGERTAGTPGRPAELFRFRREVLRERPAPGVGLPRRGPRA